MDYKTYINDNSINKYKTRDVCKTLCPLKIFFHRCFVQLDKSIKNKLHKCMKKKFIFWNCYLNNLKQFWHLDPLDLWPSDPKINRVHLLPRTDMWSKFDDGRSRWSSFFLSVTVLAHLTQWPWPLTQKWSMKMVGLGILKLLIKNEKVTDRPTDQPTCAKQYALFSSKGT